MSANVFAFPSRSKGPQPWTNDELAELYRVVDLLGRAGLSVIADMGMSDEGDPWFVFCRADNGEVIAHFARIDGHFIAASIAVDETFRGANFRQIVDRMVSSQPLVVPKPDSGSRLLLHPAVLLTAFVATALAHSEKMLAQDWLRSVEAQWEHGKSAALGEIKHIKTGWLDTLQTLWKLPLHDNRIGHDTAKEGQALTLASLIAIALAALQPIIEKVAVIAQLVADELPGHASTSHGEVSHAAQMALDGQVTDISAAISDHSAGRSHSGDDAPQAHKMAAMSVDAATDGQKTTIDASHALAAAAVQKVTLPDDGGHVTVPAIELSADVNGAFLLQQQKVAAMAQQQLETITIRVDSGSFTTAAINVQDVTPEALQIFNLHVAKSDADSSGKAVTSIGDGADGGAQIAAAGADGAGQNPQVVQSQQPSGPQVVDEANVSVGAFVKAISDFATNPAHTIDQTGSVIFSNALQTELNGLFGSNSSLKVVFFEGVSSAPDVFLLAPGVVFVAERDISPSAQFSNHGGNLVLDLTGGGQITLVGVTTIEHTASA